MCNRIKLRSVQFLQTHPSMFKRTYNSERDMSTNTMELSLLPLLFGVKIHTGWDSSVKRTQILRHRNIVPFVCSFVRCCCFGTTYSQQRRNLRYWVVFTKSFCLFICPVELFDTTSSIISITVSLYSFFFSSLMSYWFFEKSPLL